MDPNTARFLRTKKRQEESLSFQLKEAINDDNSDFEKDAD